MPTANRHCVVGFWAFAAPIRRCLFCLLIYFSVQFAKISEPVQFAAVGFFRARYWQIYTDTQRAKCFRVQTVVFAGTRIYSNAGIFVTHKKRRTIKIVISSIESKNQCAHKTCLCYDCPWLNRKNKKYTSRNCPYMSHTIANYNDKGKNNKLEAIFKNIYIC